MRGDAATLGSGVERLRRDFLCERGRKLRFRKLQIAWSLACGIVCLLLIVFWVRSHYWVEQVFVPVTRSSFVSVGSMPNRFGVGLTHQSPNGTLSTLSMPTMEWLAAMYEETSTPQTDAFWSDAMTFSISADGMIMPYWFGVLLSAAFGTAPRLRWRFSLRTLIIATTLVAVVLGLAVYASKK